MGRIYHLLLLEAKFLGTYYTSVPAATLLLKLALRPDQWKIDWTDFDELRRLRIADLASSGLQVRIENSIWLRDVGLAQHGSSFETAPLEK
jgi:hypothetical protein